MDNAVQTSSAITILNGISSEFASAAAIDIYTNTTITESDNIEIHTRKDVGHELIKRCIEIYEKAQKVNIDNVRIQVDCPLPPARGLKTSSSVSVGVIKALAQHFRAELSDYQVINLSAKASIDAGVSISGAFDDAAASLFGDLVVTKNYDKSIEYTLEIPNELKKLNGTMLIPKIKLEKRDISILNVENSLIRKAQRALLDKRYYETIDYNLQAYGPKLLHNYNSIIEMKQYDDVEILGINGAGPSLFILSSKTLDFDSWGKSITHYETKQFKFRSLDKQYSGINSSFTE